MFPLARKSTPPHTNYVWLFHLLFKLRNSKLEVLAFLFKNFLEILYLQLYILPQRYLEYVNSYMGFVKKSKVSKSAPHHISSFQALKFCPPITFSHSPVSYWFILLHTILRCELLTHLESYVTLMHCVNMIKSLT